MVCFVLFLMGAFFRYMLLVDICHFENEGVSSDRTWLRNAWEKC